MEEIEKSYVLFLPDDETDEVIPDDAGTESLDNDWSIPLVSNVSVYQEEFEEFEELPKYFITVDNWPKKTNLYCVQCHLRIKGMPWFTPLSLSKKNMTVNEMANPDLEDVDVITDSEIMQVDAYRTYLPFCLPTCVVRRLRKYKDPKVTNTWESEKLLKAIFCKVYNIQNTPLMPDLPEAEDHSLMVQYGSSGINAQKYYELNEAKITTYIDNLKS